MAGERTTSRTRTGCHSSCRTTLTRPGTGTSGSGKYGSRIVSMLAALAILLASDSIPAIVPRPAHLAVQPGAFTLRAGTVIVTDRALRKVGELLGDYLFPATGLRLAVATAAPAGTPVISIRLDSSLARLGDEGYRLDVSRSRVAIRAYRAAGAFYGIETLRQLLPPAIFRQAEMAGVAWSVPGIAIEDLPRFAWRGVHLDVAPREPREVLDRDSGDAPRHAGHFGLPENRGREELAQGLDAVERAGRPVGANRDAGPADVEPIPLVSETGEGGVEADRDRRRPGGRGGRHGEPQTGSGEEVVSQQLAHLAQGAIGHDHGAGPQRERSRLHGDVRRARHDGGDGVRREQDGQRGEHRHDSTPGFP